MKLITYGSALAVVAALSLSGCAASPTSSSSSDSNTEEVSTPEVNLDPIEGWVVFDDGSSEGTSDTWIAKKCDGTTLVYVSDGYRSGGVSTIINSPECTR